MKILSHKIFLYFILITLTLSQKSFPFDTTHWEFIPRTKYLFEKHRGSDALYLQSGYAQVKNTNL